MIFNPTMEMPDCQLQKGQEITKEELEDEIIRLEKLRTIQSNANLNLKRILNSVYGVYGFQKFILYDKAIASSISNQSHHVIRYTILFFNRYFRQVWHKLHAVHEALGITKVRPIDFDVIQYADTDSVFVYYGKIIEYTDYKGTLENFIFTLNKMQLNMDIQKMLRGYINIYNGFQTKLNGEKSMDLTFEQISWNVLWTSKKKYVKNVAWSDGNNFEPMTQVEVKGLDINKSSSPKFVRKELKDTVYQILKMGDDININALIQFVKQVKARFELAPIEDITITQRINGYEKYVIKAENDEFQYVKGIPIGVRACSVYNNELAKSSVRSKYSTIKSGTKVQWYYTNDPRSDVFAFVAGTPANEILYPVNIDKQFDVLFLSPLNKILTAIKLQPLTPSLITFNPLW